MRNPGLADGLHGHSVLTHAAAEVVELGAANLTAGHNLNLGNLGGVEGEGAPVKEADHSFTEWFES